jgi:hypothetical protein
MSLYTVSGSPQDSLQQRLNAAPPGESGPVCMEARQVSPKPTVGLSHQAPVLSAAFFSAQGAHVEHIAELHGIRFTSSLQQENSDFYRLLTHALQTLASTAGAWRQGQLGRLWGRGGRSVG